MWTKGIKNKVFTVIQNEARKKLPTKYQNTTFTGTDKSDTPATFPNVYVKKLQGAGTGYTLEDAQPNGIVSSFQIEVADNASQTTTEDIADIIADVMISLGYRMIGEPFQDNDSGAFRNIARYQRVIGANDKFI